MDVIGVYDMNSFIILLSPAHECIDFFFVSPAMKNNSILFYSVLFYIKFKHERL